MKQRDIKYFGDNLYRIRTSKNITHEQLAEALGVSTRTIYFWENNQRQITLTGIIELTIYLNCEIDELITKYEK